MKNTYTDPAAVEDRPLPAWATTAQTVADVAEVYGEAVAVAPWFEPVNGAAIANPALAPSPAPPRGDSGVAVHADADPHTAALVALAARLEQWVAEWRDVAQVYGEKTGDHLTPLAVKHGIERMQATVQSNMPNGGWD